MNSCVDMEKARREEMRWVILYALYSAQEIGTSESIIRYAIDPACPGATELEIRRALDYLEERKLIGVERKQIWYAKINNHGVDVAEYTHSNRHGVPTGRHPVDRFQRNRFPRQL